MQRAGAAVIGELIGQVLVGVFRLGGDHDTGSVAIEAMDDAGTLDAANALQRGTAMEDQRINHRAIGTAGRGMNHHADGLVDDDELIVLIEDIERDILALGLGVFRGWGN